VSSPGARRCGNIRGVTTDSIQTRACAFGVSLALLALALPCAQASARGGGARPGTLERQFAVGGILSRDFGPEPGSGGGRQVVLQPDGRELIRTSNGQIGRFLPDGSLDTGFGEGGYLTHLNAAQLALTADGRIAVAGVTGSPSATATVSRFLPDGAPDPSFGDGGSVTVTPPVPLSGSPKALFTLPDGSLLLVAFGRVGELGSLEAVKLHPDGEIDRDYGQAGFGMVPLPASEPSPEHPGIAMDGERLTVVCSGGQVDLFIARLKLDGSPDTSLGGTGTVTTKLMEGGGYNLAIQPDGRMVVSNDRSRIARFMPDGSPDLSFGEGGVEVVSALSKATVETALALAPDGKILLGGYLEAQPAWRPQDFRLARLQPDGALDPTLGAEGSGFVTTDIAAGSEDSGQGLALQPNGDILLVGGTVPPGAIFTSERIAAVRYTPDGSLDPTFGAGGIAIQRPLQRGDDHVSALATDDQGRVVLTGRAMGRVLLARYLPDGRPDPTFGGDGIVLASALASYFGQAGDSLSPYTGGRWLVGTGSPVGGALLLYEPDGSLDPGFGQGGIARSPHLNRIVNLLVAPSGVILAAGYATEPCQAFIEAYEPNGSPDRSFGEGGAVRVDGTISGVCRSHDLHLALRTDGHVLLAGRTNSIVLREYSGSGRPLPGFASAKSARRALPRKINSLALDRHGRVLLGGTLDHGIGIVRLTARGAIDRGFGRGGRATRRVGQEAVVNDIEIEAGGSIVAAGTAFPHRSGGYWEAMPVVARFGASGRPDRRFGRNGAWVGSPTAMLSSIALGRGTVLAGGWTLGHETASDLFLVGLHR
jgi:uncharacterized delta-60 repeat protein